MADFGRAFSVEGETKEVRGVIPPGEYVAQIVKSEKRQNKAANGHYWNLEFAVEEGPHKGARFWVMLNLDNPSDAAVDIAARELRSICHACGKLRGNINGTDELHHIPMIVRLKVKTDSYGEKNEVVSYAPLSGGTPHAPAAVTQRAAASGNGQKRGPWA